MRDYLKSNAQPVPAFLPPLSSHINNYQLGAGAPTSIAWPEGASHCLFSANAPFWVATGTAQIPAGDITDGTGSAYCPAQRTRETEASFSVISATAQNISIEFWSAAPEATTEVGASFGPTLYSAEEYAKAFQSLLPVGRVWPRDGVQAQAAAGLSPVYERQNARAVALLADAFPATTFELLPEWEDTLGLPSRCTGPLDTIQQRRAAIVAKFAGLGGQSAPYFISYAAALGYTITITEHAPFRCGESGCGDSLGGDDWAHTWTVNSPLDTITYFCTGQSTCGEPLRSWGNLLLECALSEIAPAHTILQFSYT